MCSFIYGCAITKPILGEYFELPGRHPPNRDLIFDEHFRKITDVIIYFTNDFFFLKFSRLIRVFSSGIRLSLYGHRKILCKRDTHFQRFR